VTSAPAPAAAPLSRRLVGLMAAAAGLVVANLYYAQPLLAQMGRDFRVGPGRAGLLVTVTQVGFAAGLLFIVPLGDRLERRRLITGVLGGTALALAALASAPTLPLLLAAAAAVGLTSVAVQLLVPFAATLAADRERGRVVGTVMSGLLLGVLASRTLAGLVGGALSWRAVYWLAAGAMVGLAMVLRRALPRSPPAVGLSYRGLLGSLPGLLRAEPVLRWRTVYGMAGFAAFSVFWTTMAFRLSRAPYHFPPAVIGLFGLVGLVGALAASVLGRVADRGWQRPATGLCLLLVGLSYGPILLGGHSLLWLVVGISLLDFGAQGSHILNQSQIYRLDPRARSRVTTVYMVGYFGGGAAGSAAAALLYAAAGWPAVCALGAGLGALGLVAWLAEGWRGLRLSRLSRPSRGRRS